MLAQYDLHQNGDDVTRPMYLRQVQPSAGKNAFPQPKQQRIHADSAVEVTPSISLKREPKRRIEIGRKGELKQYTPVSSDELKVVHRSIQLQVRVRQLSMHLDGQQFDKILSEVNRILDPEVWDADDALPGVDSFDGFVRFLVYSKSPWLSLGVSDDGEVITALRLGRELLHVWFSGRDVVRWAKFDAESKAGSSGTCSTQEFANMISDK